MGNSTGSLPRVNPFREMIVATPWENAPADVPFTTVSWPVMILPNIERLDIYKNIWENVSHLALEIDLKRLQLSSKLLNNNLEKVPIKTI